MGKEKNFFMPARTSANSRPANETKDINIWKVSKQGRRLSLYRRHLHTYDTNSEIHRSRFHFINGELRTLEIVRFYIRKEVLIRIPAVLLHNYPRRLTISRRIDSTIWRRNLLGRNELTKEINLKR